MKIAVLMSTYNGEKYLDEQLESIANQSVINNITLYIRDDGSTDKTFQIIEKWSDDIDIILYKENNMGPAKSFWKLMTNKKIIGDYYAFCDQDDIWDSDKLEVAIRSLKMDNAKPLYACNCRIINAEGNVVKDELRSEAPDMSLNRLFVNGPFQGCSMVFSDTLRRFIMSKKITKVPMHDIVVILYALFDGGIIWDKEPHFSYRVHSNNVVSKSSKSKIESIRTTIWNWRNSKINSMRYVAKELSDNVTLDKEDLKFITSIIRCKKNKIFLIKECLQTGTSKNAKRSFIIRLFLNLY